MKVLISFKGCSFLVFKLSEINVYDINKSDALNY